MHIFTQMDKGKPTGDDIIFLRCAGWLSPILLFALMVGSIVFYRERMLFIDAPHILFRIINEGGCCIEQHRYGSFISQSLPLLGAKLSLPLVWLMVLYSAGFYLFYLTVCLLLVRMKQYGLVVLMGLYFTVLVSATYYWPNNEVHQGIAWLLLAIGFYFYWLGRGYNIYLQPIVFTCSFFLAIWTHPLVIFAAVYLWVFLNVWTGSFYTNKKVWIYSALLLSLCAVKVYIGMHDWYDGGKIEMVTHIDRNKIKGLVHAPQLRYFIAGCLHHYRLFTIITISGLIGLLYQRRYWLFLWTIIFSCGYIALVCITFWDIAPIFYIESEYMPLAIVGCTPFVYAILPKMVAGKWQWGATVLAVIYVIRLGAILSAAHPFTDRLTVLTRMNFMMQEKHLDKIIVKESAPLDSVLIMSWGAPVESLMMSAMNNDTPQRTFILLKPEEIKANDTTMKDTLLGAFERLGADQLNARYFHIDTSRSYQVMTYDELMNRPKI